VSCNGDSPPGDFLGTKSGRRGWFGDELGVENDIVLISVKIAAIGWSIIMIYGTVRVWAYPPPILSVSLWVPEAEKTRIEDKS
jgi:hypothetical protein